MCEGVEDGSMRGGGELLAVFEIELVDVCRSVIVCVYDHFEVAVDVAVDISVIMIDGVGDADNVFLVEHDGVGQMLDE